MENFILVTNPGFIHNSQTFNLAVELAYIMFPYLTFISAAAFYGAILQTKKVFVPYAATSIILNATLVSALYINSFFNLHSAVHMFAYGLFISGILELSWMIFCSRKYNARLYLRKPIMSRYVRIILKRILPGIFGAGIVQISVWCDMLILSFYVGGISYLYFADRIIQLPLAIFSTANSIVLLQSLSKTTTTSDEKHTHFNRTFRITLGFILPSAAGIFIIGRAVIELLFMRGAFSHEAAMNTGIILQILSIALPFQAMSKLYYAAINATGNTSTPVRFSCISLSINIALSLILMNFIDFKCVAVATVVSSIAQFIMLMLYSELQYTTSKLTLETKKDIFKCFFASIVMMIILYTLKGNNISLIELFTYIIVGIISYGAVIIVLRVRFLADILNFRVLVKHNKPN
jgi:putative peptidoglycan lipid II flippase